MTARQDWRALSDRLTARQVRALEDVERAARGADGTSGPLAVLAAVMADHNAEQFAVFGRRRLHGRQARRRGVVGAVVAVIRGSR